MDYRWLKKLNLFQKREPSPVQLVFDFTTRFIKKGTNPRSLPPRISAKQSEPSVGQADHKLNQIWQSLRKQYFSEQSELDQYSVKWSQRRQRRTLASCNIKKKVVNVANELNHENLQRWLEPLLYHEMCHAALGTSIHSHFSKTPWHGSAFKKLERRHPLTNSLQEWIREGGWNHAVRSARGRAAAAKRLSYKLNKNIRRTPTSPNK